MSNQDVQQRTARESPVTIFQAYIGLAALLIPLLLMLIGTYIRMEGQNAHQDWVDDQRQRIVEKHEAKIEGIERSLNQIAERLGRIETKVDDLREKRR